MASMLITPTSLSQSPTDKSFSYQRRRHASAWNQGSGACSLTKWIQALTAEMPTCKKKAKFTSTLNPEPPLAFDQVHGHHSGLCKIHLNMQHNMHSSLLATTVHLLKLKHCQLFPYLSLFLSPTQNTGFCDTISKNLHVIQRHTPNDDEKKNCMGLSQ